MASSTSAQSNAFRWTDFDAYLFDIDGTLLVTRDLVHYNALNLAMREVYGVDTTIDGITYHGKTDLGILRASLERAGIVGSTFEMKLPAALQIIRREVNANASAINPAVCCGIREILASLKSAGKLLGIASGNLESVGWHKIEAAGLRVDLARGLDVGRRIADKTNFGAFAEPPSYFPNRVTENLHTHLVIIAEATEAEKLAQASRLDYGSGGCA
jgi:hypothetical protein